MSDDTPTRDCPLCGLEMHYVLKEQAWVCMEMKMEGADIQPCGGRIEARGPRETHEDPIQEMEE